MLKSLDLNFHLMIRIKFALTLHIILFSVFLQAQTFHTVEDPDITFTLEILENWRVVDDGLVLSIVPPAGGNEYLNFTYYETSEKNLDKAFEFTVLAFNKEDELETRIIDRGRDIIDKVEARWALLSFEKQGVFYHRLTYLLIKNGQYFIFQGSALAANFEHYRPLFEKMIRSLKTKKNL